MTVEIIKKTFLTREWHKSLGNYSVYGLEILLQRSLTPFLLTVYLLISFIFSISSYVSNISFIFCAQFPRSISCHIPCHLTSSLSLFYPISTSIMYHITEPYSSHPIIPTNHHPYSRCICPPPFSSSPPGAPLSSPPTWCPPGSFSWYTLLSLSIKTLTAKGKHNLCKAKLILQSNTAFVHFMLSLITPQPHQLWRGTAKTLTMHHHHHHHHHGGSPSRPWTGDSNTSTGAVDEQRPLFNSSNRLNHCNWGHNHSWHIWDIVACNPFIIKHLGLVLTKIFQVWLLSCLAFGIAAITHYCLLLRASSQRCGFFLAASSDGDGNRQRRYKGQVFLIPKPQERNRRNKTWQD